MSPLPRLAQKLPGLGCGCFLPHLWRASADTSNIGAGAGHWSPGLVTHTPLNSTTTITQQHLDAINIENVRIFLYSDLFSRVKIAKYIFVGIFNLFHSSCLVESAMLTSKNLSLVSGWFILRPFLRRQFMQIEDFDLLYNKLDFVWVIFRYNYMYYVLIKFILI